MTVHVLSYAPRLPRMLIGGGAAGSRGVAIPGGAARWLLLVASLAVGVGVAAVTMQMSRQWGVGF